MQQVTTHPSNIPLLRGRARAIALRRTHQAAAAEVMVPLVLATGLLLIWALLSHL
jgi:predicted metal-binding membrane protein